jgi:ABC-type dipeptide/oligopeptide/nickel transport system permease subunit
MTEPKGGLDPVQLIQGTSLWRDAWKRLRRNRASMVGGFIVMMMSTAALGYEIISEYLTGFTMEEQHGFVVPKPPGARSVPSTHFDLLPAAGALAFGRVDRNGDDVLDVPEVLAAYRQMEFAAIDRDGNGFLDFDEFRDAPLSTRSPSQFVPSCQKWKIIRKSLAPIEEPEIFHCDAGEDQQLDFKEAGKLLDVISVSEVRDMVINFDVDGDDFIASHEYLGLPEPRVHALGTDQLGRDLLTRLVYGARISLAVGLLATLVSFFIGVTWGATAGFIGGRVDNVMMRIVDIMYGLPFMFLVILLMVVFGQNILLLFVALGCIQWLTMARIVRGQVISLKSREFVEAARSIGVSNVAIIFRHLIPNALGPIIVYATLTVPAVMLEEAFLSFLGLGVQAPQTSWGALASEGRQLMETAPWLILYPGLALAVTLLSLNFVGDGLRDALDPQLRRN